MLLFCSVHAPPRALTARIDTTRGPSYTIDWGGSLGGRNGSSGDCHDTRGPSLITKLGR
ncbi:hypothetical protein BN1708_001083, partial [Verticillium longisporum]